MPTREYLRNPDRKIPRETLPPDSHARMHSVSPRPAAEIDIPKRTLQFRVEGPARAGTSTIRYPRTHVRYIPGPKAPWVTNCRRSLRERTNTSDTERNEYPFVPANHPLLQYPLSTIWPTLLRGDAGGAVFLPAWQKW